MRRKKSAKRREKRRGTNRRRHQSQTPYPEKRKGEIDLNETAKKQVLMTDDGFQSNLDGVNKREVDTDKMAEGLDLASQAVEEDEASGATNEPERVIHQPVEEVEDKQFEKEGLKPATSQSEAREAEKRTEEEAEAQPEVVVPKVSKPKVVKMKLVLKDDPKAEEKKPKRVSQRCLGKWTSSKAGANTTEDTVEISSEDERATPTKPGEELLKTTKLDDTPNATKTISPTPNDQRDETDEMAEGLDLASKSVGHDEPIEDNTSTCVVTKPTAQ